MAYYGAGKLGGETSVVVFARHTEARALISRAAEAKRARLSAAAADVAPPSESTALRPVAPPPAAHLTEAERLTALGERALAEALSRAAEGASGGGGARRPALTRHSLRVDPSPIAARSRS